MKQKITILQLIQQETSMDDKHKQMRHNREHCIHIASEYFHKKKRNFIVETPSRQH